MKQQTSKLDCCDIRAEDMASEPLVRELNRLRQRNVELEALEINHSLMEETLREHTHALRERIKEINCLYGVSKIVEKNRNSLSTIYQEIVDLIPASWQYPEIASAKLIINGDVYQTKNHTGSQWQQTANVVVDDDIVGVLTVGYHEPRAQCDEGPFLTEERSLLDAVADKLGRITVQKQMENALKKQAHDLRERVKEINCLYGISNLVERSDTTIEEIFQGVVELIPFSWQFPEITSAQLTMNGHTFSTEHYKESRWAQVADIMVYGKPVGMLTVCYQEKRPNSFNGPFLKEECSLLKDIAERLGRIAERKQAEKELDESQRELKKHNLLLQEKNIALREIMEQVLTEKKNLEERVLANIDRQILPLLKKLKNKESRIEKQYLQLLEDTILSMTSSFGTKLSRVIPKLTPRENEISNMIKNGLTSKEIARLLNISYRSVETYRNYIRKKLGITNKKINLASYFAGL